MSEIFVQRQLEAVDRENRRLTKQIEEMDQKCEALHISARESQMLYEETLQVKPWD